MSMFRPALLATAATFAVLSSAQAADPVLPPIIAPAPVLDLGFDWSGFYAGVGLTGSRHSWTYADGGNELILDPSIVSGELILGGNAQFGSFVVGLEGTAGLYSANLSGIVTGDLSDLPQDVQDALEDVDGTFTGTSTGWYAGLETRAGYLVTDSVLLYGALGITGIYSDNNTTFTYTDAAGDTQQETADIFGNVFGNVGVGVEFAVSQNLSLDLQYKYYGISALDFIEDSELNTSGHGVSAQVLFHF